MASEFVVYDYRSDLVKHAEGLGSWSTIDIHSTHVTSEGSDNVSSR